MAMNGGGGRGVGGNDDAVLDAHNIACIVVFFALASKEIPVGVEWAGTNYAMYYV